MQASVATIRKTDQRLDMDSYQASRHNRTPNKSAFCFRKTITHYKKKPLSKLNKKSWIHQRQLQNASEAVVGQMSLCPECRRSMKHHCLKTTSAGRSTEKVSFSSEKDTTVVENRTKTRNGVEPKSQEIFVSDSIKFSHQSLDDDDVVALLEHIKNLPSDFTIPELKLRNCNLSDDALKKIILQLNTRTIELLDVSGNANLNPTTLSELITNAKPHRVVLNECSITGNEALEESLFGKAASVRHLEVSHFGFERSCLLQMLCSAFASQITDIRLVDCCLCSDDFNFLANHIGNEVHIKILDLSCNCLDGKAMRHIAEIVSRLKKLRKLNLSDCHIDTEEITMFAAHATGKIAEIDLSDNSLGNDECLSTIGQMIKNLGIERLLLNNCYIQDVHRLIKEHKVSEEIRLCHLEIAENTGMRGHDIGILTCTWRIQQLFIFNCGFTAEDLAHFRAGLGSHKPLLLDVSDLMEIPSKEKNEEIDSLRRIIKNVKYDNAETNMAYNKLLS